MANCKDARGPIYEGLRMGKLHSRCSKFEDIIENCIINVSKRSEGPRGCCRAMTADCIACSIGITVLEFCKYHPQVVGCKELQPHPDRKRKEGEKCGMSHGLCEEGLACNKPYNSADYPGVCVKSKGQNCCRANTVECLACNNGRRVEIFCRLHTEIEECRDDFSRFWCPLMSCFECNDTKVQNFCSKTCASCHVQDCPMRRCATTPVCGSDGNTYPSKCALETVACEKKNPYLKFVYNGACEVLRPGKIEKLQKVGDPLFYCIQTTTSQCDSQCKDLCIEAKKQRKHNGPCIDDQHRLYVNGDGVCQTDGNKKCPKNYHQCDCAVTCQPLDSSPVTLPPMQMKPGMSCVAHCDICDSWCQAQEQQNTLTTDGSGRKCSVKGRKLQCDKDRAPCGGTLGHLCRCQTKCPP